MKKDEIILEYALACREMFEALLDVRVQFDAGWITSDEALEDMIAIIDRTIKDM